MIATGKMNFNLRFNPLKMIIKMCLATQILDYLNVQLKYKTNHEFNV